MRGRGGEVLGGPELEAFYPIQDGQFSHSHVVYEPQHVIVGKMAHDAHQANPYHS